METMNTLYLLQFGCLIFMVINAALLVMSRLYVRWENKRYEHSRWLIVIAFFILAFQYLAQIQGEIRASGDDLGAIVNMLIYAPSFALIAYGIYNIEATQPRRRRMVIVSMVLCALLFFTLTFISLGINYVPTESLLDDEAERIVAQRYAETRRGGASSETSSEAEASAGETTEDGNQFLVPSLTDEQKAIIEEKLQQWCLGNGYKDTAVNMLTLSDSIDITRAELTQYFDKCLDTTFRIWLANIRFEAAKTMMRQFPKYSNDLISVECGFSSRTYLYCIFKEKTGKTPTEWRTGVQTS